MSENVLYRKTVVVTGATTSLGAAVCQRLATEGARLVVHYNSPFESRRAEDIVDACIAAGGDAFPICEDMASAPSIERLLDTAVRRFGSLHATVHTAGVDERRRLIDLTEEAFDLQLDVSAKAALFLMVETAKRIEAGGRIITFASAAQAPLGRATTAPIEQYAARLAGELVDRRVTVNNLALGDCSVSASNSGGGASIAHVLKWVRFLLSAECAFNGWTVFVDAERVPAAGSSPAALVGRHQVPA
ncbi:SDR family NAD(P)-dependent oxidoreductase [Nocardioides sp. CER19]|uniref:SDR family NAD(P)-dependent oxidoreductase n=1 Tax=Nocardioides sp. CER19 TaxID=3038538 RepID=UPI002448EF8D|nr:SDR family NAD(P)-dependent oxidoreductase [Nocardioides sp. CER19]MDH2415248.1 SDR family oxidoreductase [Nocardioides sp. CER19]